MSPITDWGVPSWLDAEAYGQCEDRPLKDWRWEFLRRRADFRNDFEAAFRKSLKFYRELHGPEIKLIEPGEPGFTAITTTEQHAKYGTSLYDPRVSHHPGLFFQTRVDRTGLVKGKGSIWDESCAKAYVPDGALAIMIDLDEPLAPQFEKWRNGPNREWLEMLQRDRHNRVLKRKPERANWPLYLRALDARDAGASYAVIAEALLPRRTDEAGEKAPATPQSARDLVDNARATALRF